MFVTYFAQAFVVSNKLLLLINVCNQNTKNESDSIKFSTQQQQQQRKNIGKIPKFSACDGFTAAPLTLDIVSLF